MVNTLFNIRESKNRKKDGLFYQINEIGLNNYLFIKIKITKIKIFYYKLGRIIK